MRIRAWLIYKRLLKNHPVRAPGLQKSRFASKSCRPRALTRRWKDFFNNLEFLEKALAFN
jgi:hypothetical protein